MRARILGATVGLLLTGALGAWGAEPAMQPLQFFVGSWNCAGHFIANGAAINSTVTFAYDAATATLSVHHDDLAPNKYHAVELWGPSKTGGYRNSLGDAYSGIRWFSSPGFVGDSLAWTRGDASEAPVERFIYLRKGTAMTIEWWVAKPGAALVLGDTLDCRRDA